MKAQVRLLSAVFLFLFFVFHSHEVSQGRLDILHKRHVNNTEAVCNDGSRATFFIGIGSSKKWIVFFESGGLCASSTECNIRYLNENSTVLMTSKLMPEEVQGTDILSTDVAKNPVFYDYTRVLVPYCSSDLWLGRRTNPRPFKFVNSSNVDNFSFRGYTIFRSVIKDLITRFGLSKVDELVLSGSSAGALGVLNHAQWVQDHLTSLRRKPLKLSALLDSGWFINFQQSVHLRFNAKIFELYGNSSPACSDGTYGFPCCVSASCMMTRGYFPATAPVFVVFSKYDLYMYASTLKRLVGEGKTAKSRPADFASSVSMYGGAMYESLMEVEFRLSNMSYFVPACFQHIYLCTSSLWKNDGPLKPHNEITREIGKFRHVIKEGTWAATKIRSPGQNTSMMKAISLWKTGEQRVRLIDTCHGALCNPSCPDELLFVDPATNWGDLVNSVIIGFSFLFTLLCVSLKVHAMIHFTVGQRRQRRYLTESKSQDKEELLICRTEESISISCLSLGYSVDVMHGIGEAKQGERDLRKTEKDADYSNQGVSATPPHGVTYDRNGRGLRMNSARDSIVWPEWPSSYPRDDDDGSVFEKDVEREEYDQLAVSRDSLHLNHEGHVIDPLKKNSLDASLNSYGKGIAMGRISMDTKISLDGKPDKARERNRLSTSKLKHRRKKRPSKQIIHDVSVYFNPGELVAVMGPSGSGKTTLLDLLTGRRKDQGERKGEIFVNGSNLETVEDWYGKKVGYVLQLATPYYENLTVRQNLTFAAHMRLPKEMSHRRKYERVEQIMAESGLSSLADNVVGGSVGPGLSGGQKRRLCVALQMINMPLVLLLDEPTSGLDASSSLELLNHLNLVAESGRLVVLTIHQPRLEIFYLFHKILFLCNGQVAYYGDPMAAPKTFLEAYIHGTTESFRLSEDAPKVDAQNPADTIIDILGCKEGRQALLEYYQRSGEPEAIQEAINVYRNERKQSISKAKNSKEDAGLFNRLSVLENRVAVGQTTGQILYFPLIFSIFGMMIGTAYWRAQNKGGVLLMSAYCVYSCASTLFLSAVLMVQIDKALQIFKLEHADGVGHSYENLIQTYSRTATLCVLPVIVCSTTSYFMLMTTYDLWEFFVITIISLVLNQTWVAVYMMVICASPRIAHRICPMVSAAAGFAGAFLVPVPQMPAAYYWLFFINPQYYGYSAITKILMKDLSIKCAYNSTLNCFGSDGNAVLARFGFSEINPYSHLVIMFTITLLSLFLAWIFLEMRFTNMASFLKRRAWTFGFKVDGKQPSETVPLSNRKRIGRSIKRTPSRRSTLRLVSGNKGEHAVFDTSAGKNGSRGPSTRKAAMARRKSSQIIYERKLAFYSQLTQMVGVVRRMSEMSVSTQSLNLQMARSVDSISEEQEGMGSDPDEQQEKRPKRWSSDRAPRTHVDEEFCTKALNSKTAVDGAFDAAMENHRVKKRSKSEPPRKNRNQAPVDDTGLRAESDNKESKEHADNFDPEMKPPSTRVRKISIVEDPDIEKLELSEVLSAAPNTSEVNSIAGYCDVAKYRSLVDALSQSSEEYSEKSEPGSVQSFLASQNGASETRL